MTNAVRPAPVLCWALPGDLSDEVEKHRPRFPVSDANFKPGIIAVENNLSLPIEINRNRSSTSSKWLAGLCWVQVAATAAAAVGTFFEVETIIGFGPAIAFLGFVLALVSLQRLSVNLLLFGLSSPVVTATLAILIASFDLQPRQAEIPARILLTLNAGVTVVWGTLTGILIIRSSSLGRSTEKSRFSFSVRSLLGVVTFTSLLFALLRYLVGRGEMVWFAAYGIGILVLSVAVFLWFLYRAKSCVS